MSPHPGVRLGVVQAALVEPIARDAANDRAILAAVGLNIAHHAELARRAAAEGVQFACMPEDICGLSELAVYGSPEVFRRVVHAQCEAWLDAVSAMARDARMFLVTSLPTVRGHAIHNTAVLVDPEGRLLLAYHKTHLPPREDLVFTVGDDYPVQETPFGPVGALICWDMMFPEPARILALRGAVLVACPTLGLDFGGEAIGVARLQTRAFDNGLTVLCAMRAGDGEIGRSCIIDPAGRVLADAGHSRDGIVWADHDPGQPPVDLADPEGREGLDMRQRWRRSRRPGTYGLLCRR